MTLIPAKPVLHRELLVAARSKQTHRLRFVMGLIALLGIAVALVVMSHTTVAAGGGKKLLAGVSTAAYLYCLAMGFSLTLGAIREERDQGTLSLLFLTSLRGGQIVFAKLFARSLRTFEGLLAILPVFALCLLLGGVTMGEFARVGLALINTLFVSACLGMYISTKRLQLAAAAFLAGTLALALGIVAPFLANLLTVDYNMPGVGWVVGGFTPWFPIQVALDSKQSSEYYWPMLAGSFLTGFLFLILAIRSVRNNWQDKPNQTRKLRRLKEFQNWDFKSASRDPKYRAELLDQNPIFWLNSRDRFRSIGYWVYFVLIYSLLAFAWALLGPHDSPLPFFWVAVLMFDFGIWAKLNQSAGIQLVEERKLGSLEMILCAPVGLPRILSGLWMALRKQFGRVLLASTLLNFVITLIIMAMHGDDSRFARVAEPSTIFWVFVYYTIANISIWVALSWVGMWFGLRNKPDSSMSSFGLVRVLARPFLFYVLGFILLFITELAGAQVARHLSIGKWVVACSLCVVASNILYVLKAKARIPQAFQLAATGTLDEPMTSAKPAAPERTSIARPSLLARLWRRKILRWVVPLAVVVLFVAGNRWRMHREYRSRVEQLHQQGTPTTLDGLYEKAVAGLPTKRPTKVLEAYNQIRPTVTVWRAIDRLEDSGTMTKTRRAMELAVIRSHVETNRQALATIKLGLAQDDAAFLPELEYSSPLLQKIGQLNQLLHAAVLLAAHEGDADAAHARLTLMIRLGLLRSQAGALAPGNYRAAEMDRLHSAVQLTLSAGDVGRERLDALQTEIGRCFATGPEDRAQHVDALRARLLALFSMQDPDDLLAELSYKLPNELSGAEKFHFGLFRLFGGIERAHLTTLDLAELASKIATDPSPALLLKSKLLLQELTPDRHSFYAANDFSHSIVHFYQAELHLRLCVAAVAVERFRQDHVGALPKTMDELYPLYLNTIPVDPMMGVPLAIVPEDQGYTIRTESDERQHLSRWSMIENARITIRR